MIIGVEDSRCEVFEANTPHAEKIAGVVDKRYFKKNKSYYDLDLQSCLTLGEAQNLCQGERFATQKVLMCSTCFAIDSNWILMPKHCLFTNSRNAPRNEQHFLAHFKFVFGYCIDKKTGTERTQFDTEQIYTPQEIKLHPNLDLTLVKTKEKIHNDLIINSLHKEKLNKNKKLYMLGHPSGLPLKIAVKGRLLGKNKNDNMLYDTTLDAFKGNSGSPIFNEKHDCVGILLETQGQDYVPDQLPCYTAYKTNYTTKDSSQLLAVADFKDFIDFVF